MKYIKLITLLAFLSIPSLASAADTGNIEMFFEEVGQVVSLLIPIAFALILLFFFWGLAKYMLGDAEDKEKGKNLMIWGVIALFVAASVWGLVAFLGEVIGVDPTADPDNPYIQGNGAFSI